MKQNKGQKSKRRVLDYNRQLTFGIVKALYFELMKIIEGQLATLKRFKWYGLGL